MIASSAPVASRPVRSGAFNLANVFVLFPPLLWGANFVVGSIVTQELSPHWVNFVRWLFALLVLLPLSLPYLARDLPALWASRYRLTALACLGIVGSNTLIYASLQHLSAPVASIIYSMVPVLIPILGGIMQWRMPRSRAIGLAVLSVAGVVLLQAGSIPDDVGQNQILGIGIMLGAALCWSCFCILAQRTALNAAPISSLVSQIAIGLAIELVLISVVLDLPVPPRPTNTALLGLAFIGIFPAAVGYLWWQAALRSVHVVFAGLATNLVPLSSVAITWCLFGKQLSSLQWAGLAAIVLAVSTHVLLEACRN